MWFRISGSFARVLMNAVEVVWLCARVLQGVLKGTI